MTVAPLTIAYLFSGTKIKAINNRHNILHTKQQKELLLLDHGKKLEVSHGKCKAQ